MKHGLVATGGRKLVESVGDKFWGVGRDGKGSNHLGCILMTLRANLADMGTMPTGSSEGSEAVSGQVACGSCRGSPQELPQRMIVTPGCGVEGVCCSRECSGVGLVGHHEGHLLNESCPLVSKEEPLVMTRPASAPLGAALTYDVAHPLTPQLVADVVAPSYEPW